MKGIAFVGKKGGTGKTALAHGFALGACWKNIPAYMLHTDDREPLTVNGRPYQYYDARDPKVIETLTKAAVNQDGLFVIDGGGNKPKYDKWIAGSMDLVIIPMPPDEEAVLTNLEHGSELESAGGNVRYMINAYPSNRFEREHIKQYLAPIPQEKIIGRVEECKAIRMIRNNDNPIFKTPPSRVNNLCRKLYFDIKQELAAIDGPKRG